MDTCMHKTMVSIASLEKVKSLCRGKQGKNFEKNYYLRA